MCAYFRYVTVSVYPEYFIVGILFKIVTFLIFNGVLSFFFVVGGEATRT